MNNPINTQITSDSLLSSSTFDKKERVLPSSKGLVCSYLTATSMIVDGNIKEDKVRIKYHNVLNNFLSPANEANLIYNLIELLNKDPNKPYISYLANKIAGANIHEEKSVRPGVEEKVASSTHLAINELIKTNDGRKLINIDLLAENNIKAIAEIVTSEITQSLSFELAIKGLKESNTKSHSFNSDINKKKYLKSLQTIILSSLLHFHNSISYCSLGDSDSGSMTTIKGLDITLINRYSQLFSCYLYENLSKVVDQNILKELNESITKLTFKDYACKGWSGDLLFIYSLAHNLDGLRDCYLSATQGIDKIKTLPQLLSTDTTEYINQFHIKKTEIEIPTNVLSITFNISEFLTIIVSKNSETNLTRVGLLFSDKHSELKLNLYSEDEQIWRLSLLKEKCIDCIRALSENNPSEELFLNSLKKLHEIGIYFADKIFKTLPTFTSYIKGKNFLGLAYNLDSIILLIDNKDLADATLSINTDLQKSNYTLENIKSVPSEGVTTITLAFKDKLNDQDQNIPENSEDPLKSEIAKMRNLLSSCFNSNKEVIDFIVKHFNVEYVNHEGKGSHHKLRRNNLSYALGPGMRSETEKVKHNLIKNILNGLSISVNDFNDKIKEVYKIS